MKRFTVIAGLVLCFAGTQFAQNDERPARISPAALSKIVGVVLRSEFNPARQRKVVYLWGRSLKEEWLPKITNTEFILIDDAGLEKLGKAHLFKDPVVEKGKVRVDFGFGDNCVAGGHSYFFRVTGKRATRLMDNGGWGSGCSSGNGAAKGSGIDR